MNSTLNSLLKRLDENFRFKQYELDGGDFDEDVIDDEFNGEDFDVLEDVNTTSNLDGGQGQPQTPYAFSKKVQNPEDVAYSNDVEHTNRFFKQINDVYKNAILELNYRDYKRDDTRTEKEKINSNIVEINRKLKEVEQMINHASRLKMESGSDQGIFWKGTLANFTKINERLIRLSSKIREFNT